jgi:hypothetical protein
MIEFSKCGQRFVLWEEGEEGEEVQGRGEGGREGGREGGTHLMT